MQTRKSRIHLLQQSQLGENSVHSLLISLLRGLAAVQVAASHLRAEMFPSLRTMADPPLAYQGLAFVSGFAHQAVVVFFLISGWLVGGSLLNKLGQPDALKGYAIDRLSRLWTVLIPTFCLMLLFGLLTGALSPAGIDWSSANDFSALSFLGNLVGLQTVIINNFGGNYALWSLANETWYYLMFPLLLVGIRARRLVPRAAAGLALVAIALCVPYAIVLYFLIWLLGALFSRVRITCGKVVRIALLAAAAAIFVYYRLTGVNNDMEPESFVQDLVSGLALLLFLSSMQVRADPASRPLARLRTISKFFSEFSFTLYVLHVPLIHLMRYGGRVMFGTDRLSPLIALDYAIYCGMLGALLALSYLSYVAFESNTPAVRGVLKDRLLYRSRRALRQT